MNAAARPKTTSAAPASSATTLRLLRKATTRTPNRFAIVDKTINSALTPTSCQWVRLSTPNHDMMKGVIPIVADDTEATCAICTHQPTCQPSPRLRNRDTIWYAPPASGYADVSSATQIA